MATTVTHYEIDYSEGLTDAKYWQNIKALTFGNRLKGVYHVNETAVNLGGFDTTEGETVSVTVTGAALGDAVTNITCSLDLQDLNVTGYVQSANTVELKFTYVGTESIDLAAATFTFDVLDFT